MQQQEFLVFRFSTVFVVVVFASSSYSFSSSSSSSSLSSSASFRWISREKNLFPSFFRVFNEFSLSLVFGAGGFPLLHLFLPLRRRWRRGGREGEEEEEVVGCLKIFDICWSFLSGFLWECFLHCRILRDFLQDLFFQDSLLDSFRDSWETGRPFWHFCRILFQDFCRILLQDSFRDFCRFFGFNFWILFRDFCRILSRILFGISVDSLDSFDRILCRIFQDFLNRILCRILFGILGHFQRISGCLLILLSEDSLDSFRDSFRDSSQDSF